VGDNCKLYEDLLVQEALGEISERERAYLKRHLAACAECRRELASYSDVVGVMKKERREEAPAGLAERTLGRIERAGDRFSVAASPYHETELWKPSTWKVRRALVAWMAAASILVMAVASLVPGMIGADSQRSLLSCQEHMKVVATALQQYAKDHNGFYPEGPQWYKELDWQYLQRVGALVCPARLAVGAASAKETDFVYNPHRVSANQASDYPLLWDKKAAHDRLGRNVLFAGGRIDWLAEEPFEKLLTRYRIDETKAYY